MNSIFEEIATRFEHDENKRNIHDHQHTDGSYAPLIKSPTFHNPKQLALPTFYLGKTVEEWRLHSGSGTGDFEDKESFKVEKHKISINYKNEGREEKTNVKKKNQKGTKQFSQEGPRGKIEPMVDNSSNNE